MATDKSILNRLDNLEQMVLGLATRINKIADSANETVKASEIAKDWRKERDEWNKLERDPEHYDERCKPRLDKYLAYIYVNFNGVKKSYLLSRNWNIELLRYKSSNNEKELAACCISGIIDTKTFKREIIKFAITGPEVALLTGLDGFLKTFQDALYQLANKGSLNVDDMYDDPEHDFRSLEIDVSDIETTFRVTNLCYSNYGCMEENEPMYEEVFLHSISVETILA